MLVYQRVVRMLRESHGVFLAYKWTRTTLMAEEHESTVRNAN
jgi:hypothetical protein